jgi:hypothetical protein
MACRTFANHGQLPRRTHITRFHRIAIHCRGGKGRLITLRSYITGQNPAIGLI